MKWQVVGKIVAKELNSKCLGFDIFCNYLLFLEKFGKNLQVLQRDFGPFKVGCKLLLCAACSAHSTRPILQRSRIEAHFLCQKSGVVKM